MQNDPLTDAEIELARLRGAIEELRLYLTGPCNSECEGAEQYHRHYTDRYEQERGVIVVLNHILWGHYDYPSTLRQIGERGPRPSDA